MQTNEFFIESGMSCQSCATRLEKGLLKNKHIQHVLVNFATRSLVVSSELNAKELENYVHSLGFTVALKNELIHYSQQEIRNQKKNLFNLILTFIFSLPVVIIGMGNVYFWGSNAIQFILTTIILFYSGKSFFTNAYQAARQRSANMDTLVVLSAFSAWLYSTSVIFMANHTRHLYFETTAMLLFLILVGKFLEDKAKYKASQTLRDLILLKPEIANLITQKNHLEIIESIPTKQIEINQVLLVRAGEKIPADGVVLEGESEIDMSFMTGESLPINVKLDSIVVAGSLNLNSSFKMKVTKVGEQSELAKIIQLVEKAQNSKIKLQKIADSVSQFFIPLVLFISLVTFLSWYFFTHQFAHALMNSIAVLVVACPCALGLATPIAVLVATGKAARQGVLIRDAIGLEQLSQIDTIVFDKTGTLTEGHIRVVQFFLRENREESEILSALYLVEQHSSHPISRAIFLWLSEKNTDAMNNTQQTLEIKNIKEIAGQGIEWTKEGELYFTGKIQAETLTQEEKIWLENKTRSLNMPASIVGIFKNKGLMGVFFLTDEIRKNSRNILRFLEKNKINVIMATGDNFDIAQFVAQNLKIDEFYANQKPQDKYHLISKLKKCGKKIAMVGDGINDAAALTEAHVGIAMGAGTQIAAQSAQIILQKNDPEKIAFAIILARKTKSIIIQNFFFAFAYNIVLIPLAAFGKLNPMVAAACMGFSSLIVVLNSLRLRNN